MHLAVHRAFPSLYASAGREFVARLHIAGRNLGWQILRRPSLLLGPLAPGWRALRNRLLRKARRVKEQQDREIFALRDRVNTLEERSRDAEQARREAALVLQQLALREMDIADMRRRHAALTEENALLAAAMPCDRQIGAPISRTGTEGMDQPALALSADQTQNNIGKA